MHHFILYEIITKIIHLLIYRSQWEDDLFITSVNSLWFMMFMLSIIVQLQSHDHKELDDDIITVCYSLTFSTRRQQKQRANRSTRSLRLPWSRPLPLPTCSANGPSAPFPASQSAAGSEFLSTNGEVDSITFFNSNLEKFFLHVGFRL